MTRGFGSWQLDTIFYFFLLKQLDTILSQLKWLWEMEKYMNHRNHGLSLRSSPMHCKGLKEGLRLLIFSGVCGFYLVKGERYFCLSPQNPKPYLWLCVILSSASIVQVSSWLALFISFPRLMMDSGDGVIQWVSEFDFSHLSQSHSLTVFVSFSCFTRTATALNYYIYNWISVFDRHNISFLFCDAFRCLLWTSSN